MNIPDMRRSIVLAASITAVSTVLGALAVLAPAGATKGTARAGPSTYRGTEHHTVLGAKRREVTCLSDLTTTGTVKNDHPDLGQLTGFGGLSAPGSETT